jgi:hypothetical protein
MEIRNLPRMDSRDTVAKFNEALIALSVGPFRNRKFVRNVRGSLGVGCYLPPMLTLEEIASSAYCLGRRQSWPIEYHSEEIKAKAGTSPRLSVVYFPQFSEGCYDERLPEIDVGIVTFGESKIGSEVVSELERIGLRPKSKCYENTRGKEIIIYSPIYQARFDVPGQSQ